MSSINLNMFIIKNLIKWTLMPTQYPIAVAEKHNKFDFYSHKSSFDKISDKVNGGHYEKML